MQECTQYQATIPANSTVIYELTLKEFEKVGAFNNSRELVAASVVVNSFVTQNIHSRA